MRIYLENYRCSCRSNGGQLVLLELRLIMIMIRLLLLMVNDAAATEITHVDVLVD